MFRNLLAIHIRKGTAVPFLIFIVIGYISLLQEFALEKRNSLFEQLCDAISRINVSKILILAVRYSQDGDTGRAIILNIAKVESLKHRKLELRDDNKKSTTLRILGLLWVFQNDIAHVCSYSQSQDQFV